MAVETVNLELGKSEAIVLFDLLTDFYKQPSLSVNDNAERLALVRLHGSIEKSMSEIFSPEYKAILNQARADLARQWGTAK